MPKQGRRNGGSWCRRETKALGRSGLTVTETQVPAPSPARPLSLSLQDKPPEVAMTPDPRGEAAGDAAALGQRRRTETPDEAESDPLMCSHPARWARSPHARFLETNVEGRLCGGRNMAEKGRHVCEKKPQPETARSPRLPDPRCSSSRSPRPLLLSPASVKGEMTSGRRTQPERSPRTRD